ncbi:predicted protein [Micromonas commoda]|uniref:Uncharacterized protein n=1 Tax=Micromonas commoda (strain RCC299 / NOUM17 / CCMP2709) TaxID=296587 RepID=C1EBU2_MICCC|nr:predicted protein [Micromonas commoda]ACO65473.1 predicted protein [Micromonas commoda]|eukprot:XP_002504215.1 predicted protein [Micromonas commoda]
MSGGMGVPIPPPGAGGRFGPNDAKKSGRRDRRGGGNSRRASRGATGKGGSGGDASASSNGDASAPRDPRARYDPKYDSFTRGLGAPGSSSWNAGSTGFSSQWPNLPPAGGARSPATPSVSSQTGPSSSSKFPDILRDTYKPQPQTIRTGKWPYNYVNVATGGLTGAPPAGAPTPPAPGSASSPAGVQSGPSATFRSALQSGRYPVPSRSGADALRSIATGGGAGGGKTGSPVASPATTTKTAPSRPPGSSAASSQSSTPSTNKPPSNATNKPPRLNGTNGRAPRVGSRARGPAKRFTIKSADGLGYPLGPVPVIAMIGAPLCWIGYNSTPKMAVVDRKEFNRKGGASASASGAGDGDGAKKLRRAGDAIAAAAGAALGAAPAGASGGAPDFSKAKKELAKAKAKVEAKAAPPGKAKVETSDCGGGPPVGVMAALVGVAGAAAAVGAAVVKSGVDAAAKQKAQDDAKAAQDAKAAAKAKAQEAEEKKKAKLEASLSPHAAAPTPDAPKGANAGTKKTAPRTGPEGEAAAKAEADKKAQEAAVSKVEADKAAKAEAEAKAKAEADAEAERKREEARKRKEQVKHEVEQKEKAIEAEAAAQKQKQAVEAKLNDIAASQTKAEDKKKEDKKAKMKEEKKEEKKAAKQAAKQAETANAGG